MSRIIFRALIGVTLAVVFLSRGRMQAMLFLPFYYWFLLSGFVFGAFGIYAAYRAWREPVNRRAYLFDTLLAASWIPYWLRNMRP